MNADILRELLRRRPFQPFAVRMADGETHAVPDPDSAMSAGSRFLVHYPETDRIAILSLLHVAGIEMLQSA